jgi:HSP20 family molecular chaperone IbpA
MSEHKNTVVPKHSNSNRENENYKMSLLNDNFMFPSMAIQNHMKSFDEMMNKMFNDDLKLMPNMNMGMSLADTKNLGFFERNGKYIYEVDIPKDMLNFMKISEKDGMITISAKKEIIKEGNNSKSSSSQTYYRSVGIPPDANGDSIKAEYSHGKLEIIVEKK